MKKWFSLLVITAIPLKILAQNSFTVEESWKYAAEHNVNIVKAKIDQKIADQKVKETTGIGLPQINAQGQYNNFLNGPYQALPSEFLGQAPGRFIPAKFGAKQSVTGGITISQLLFSGSYLVGLQSSKAYKETMALVEEKTEISIKEAILMAYTAVLVTDENINTLAKNIQVTEKNLHDTRETYKVGLIEEQNVQQLEYSYKSLKTNQENLKRSREVYVRGLKYLMNYPLDQEITLTTNLEELLKENEKLVSNLKNQDVASHIDIRLKDNALKLSELKLKLQKTQSLPTLGVALSSNYNAASQKFTFFDSNQQWYNNTVLAFQLNVPIFSGLQRHWQLEQAKLDLEKAKLDKDDAEKTVKNNLHSASVDYENAYNSFQNTQDLIALSSDIFRKQQIKFKEGIGTSFDLQQSENQLYSSQANYYKAALDLVQSKIKLDEAQGKLISK